MFVRLVKFDDFADLFGLTLGATYGVLSTNDDGSVNIRDDDGDPNQLLPGEFVEVTDADHFVGDGRGNRNVFKDGELLRNVIACNTDEGWATIAAMPMTLNNQDEVESLTVHGHITVAFIKEF